MSSQASPPVPSHFLNAKAAEQYENAEKATRPFGKIIVEKSGIAQSIEAGEEVRVLDFACGTGAVIQELYDSVPKEKWGQLKVTGTDFSPAMLEYLDKRAQREGWTGLDTKIVDANMPGFKDDITKALPASTYTHIFISFAVISMPSHTLQRLNSLLRPNGFIAVTSWVIIPWYPVLARTISLMSAPQPYLPSRKEVEDLFCKEWASKSYMGQQLQEAGFPNQSVVTEKKTVRVGSPETFVTTMFFPIGFISKKWWEEDGREDKVQELNSVMKKVTAETAKEDGAVELEFEGIIGWGWKSG
ncbi:S-adenosyl-L-methionine-dependent methyltransferase [Curvularia clavata]|uniref:S-adenosyl-L-methionine-dependent methyltransferase n=1 Tax=Curvularia clavata TaxID=95742 RepID=A0A9Q8Z8U2_CURCL|nr:S-adenosyl-L-methionine-dependent methyltransferase [Curvularia clavata]